MFYRRFLAAGPPSTADFRWGWAVFSTIRDPRNMPLCGIPRCVFSAPYQPPRGPARGLRTSGFLGMVPEVAWIPTSDSVSEYSFSWTLTLCDDLATFFDPVLGESTGAVSVLALSHIFLSIIQILLKQLKVSSPTGFLKSNPDIVISLTHS